MPWVHDGSGAGRHEILFSDSNALETPFQ
jgi:hypothetical protein